jgi:hypothetical protein
VLRLALAAGLGAALLGALSLIFFFPTGARLRGLTGAVRAAPPVVAGGAAAASVIAAAAVGALLLAGGLRIGAAGQGRAAAVLAGVGVALLVALAQELAVHGWLLRRLERALGRLAAIGVTSLGFAAIHLGRPGETPAGLIGLFLFASVAGAGALRSGALAWAVGFHFAWNAAQDQLLGLADSGARPSASVFAAAAAGPSLLSGGSAGLEASAPALLLFGAAALWLLRPRGDARSGANR